MTARVRTAFLAPLLLVLASGCDLFATRQPIVESAEQSLWTPPTEPEIVVTNLELAFEIGNFNDYQRALTEDFTFRPDNSDVVQLDLEYPGQDVFADWTREVEVATAQTIWNAADSVFVDFTQFDDDLGQTVRLLKYDYVLTLRTAGQEDSIWEGQAWFTTVQQPNGEWLIQDWEDVASSASRESWGRLKGRNRT